MYSLAQPDMITAKRSADLTAMRNWLQRRLPLLVRTKRVPRYKSWSGRIVTPTCSSFVIVTFDSREQSFGTEALQADRATVPIAKGWSFRLSSIKSQIVAHGDAHVYAIWRTFCSVSEMRRPSAPGLNGFSEVNW